MATPNDSRMQLFQLVDRLLAEAKVPSAQRSGAQDSLSRYMARTARLKDAMGLCSVMVHANRQLHGR